MSRLPKVITSSVIRSAHQGQSTPGLCPAGIRRGLGMINDSLVLGGSSPDTISVYQLGRPKWPKGSNSLRMSEMLCMDLKSGYFNHHKSLDVPKKLQAILSQGYQFMHLYCRLGAPPSDRIRNVNFFLQFSYILVTAL